MGAHPPHDADAERALLGAILLDRTALQKVAGLLGAEDFYLKPHGVIYQSCVHLHERRQAADLVTVTSQLRENGELERVGGATYVATLIDELADVANVVHYAQIVSRLAHDRTVASTASNLALHPSDPVAVRAMKEALAARFALIHGDGFPVASFAELARADLPEREPLIAPWLNRRELAMIYGTKGVGKSYLALSLAVAAATGTPVLGWCAPEPVKVLYVDGEMNAGEIRRRIAAIARAVPNIDLQLLGANLQIVSREYLAGMGVRMPYFTNPEARERFVRTVAPEVALVSLDNLSCLFGGEENDAAAWDPALEMLLQLKHGGAAVVLLHHPGKQGDQRGTSRREDALDVSLKLESRIREGELAADAVHFRTVWAKHRAFRLNEVPSLTCSLNVDWEQVRAVWTYEEVGDARIWALLEIRTRLLAETGKEPSVRKLTDVMKDLAKADGRSELDLSKSTVDRLLRQAREGGMLTEDGVESRPTGYERKGTPVPSGQQPQTQAIWEQFVQQLTHYSKELEGPVPVVPSSNVSHTDQAVSPSVPPPLKGWDAGQPRSETGSNIQEPRLSGSPADVEAGCKPSPDDKPGESVLPQDIVSWPRDAKLCLRDLRAAGVPKAAAVARVRETYGGRRLTAATG